MFWCRLPVACSWDTGAGDSLTQAPDTAQEREYQFKCPADILCLGRNNETREVKCFDNSLNSTKHKELFLLVVMIKNPASSSQFQAPREV